MRDLVELVFVVVVLFELSSLRSRMRYVEEKRGSTP